jgi:ankyrin repeat protein
VCELYNNGGIARVFGRPKILEIIFDPPDPNSDWTDGKAGIYTLQEYVRGKGKDKWYRCSGKQREGDAESDSKEKAPITAFSPNLSLNIGIKKQHNYVFWGVAFGGLILQGTVLVFAATVTYYLKWGKNGGRPESYACPLVIIGTLLVCGGMFFCAFLVGQSTEEEVWCWKGKKDNDKSSLHWVQPGGQVIGDQTFDAFSHSDCDHELKEYIISWKKKRSEKSEWAVWAAAGVTVSGFVLQFTGLRGVHSAVSVAQLGVVMAMGMARAALRMRRLKPNANSFASCPDEVIGHELDWLALHIDRDGLQSALGPPSTASSPPTTQYRYFWKFCGTPDPATRIMPGSSPRTDGSNAAAKLLAYRTRLAQLTESPSIQSMSTTSARNFEVGMVEVRRIAQQLAVAIESTVNIIFSASAKIREEWVKEELMQWGINCKVSSKELSTGYAHSEVKGGFQKPLHTLFLQLSHETKDANILTNTWRLRNKLELEGLLGLWLWSLKSDPAVETVDPQNELIISRATEISARRIVSTNRKIAETDLTIWVGGRTPNLIESTLKLRPTEISGPSTIWRVNNENVYESQSSRLPESLDKRTVRFFGWYAADLSECQPSEQPRIWSTATDGSLLSQCAQEVFGSFLKSALGIVEDFGTITIQEEVPHFRLENHLMSNIAKSFTENQLGSHTEALLCILPAALPQLRVPSSRSALAAARNSANQYRRQKKWKEAEGILQWAWSICTARTPSQEDSKSVEEFAEQAAVALGELYRSALRDPGTKQFGSDGIKWLSDQKSSGNHPPSDSLTKVLDRYHAINVPATLPADSADVDFLSIIKEGDLTETLIYLTHRTLAIPNEIKGNALCLAAGHGWSEVVLDLLELAAEPDYKDQHSRTALSHAAQGGDADTVKELMDWGAFPNSEDLDHRTPLSYASEAGQMSVVEILLADARTAPDLRDENGRTPLAWAAVGGHKEIVQMLLDKGADINVKDRGGYTPLLRTILRGQEEMTQMLLDKGADVKNEHGSTALEYTILQGSKEMTQMLLDNGADVNARDRVGRTPPMYAMFHGQKEIA